MALAVVIHPNQSTRGTVSPLKNKILDENCSSSQHSSSVHDTLSAETERRKERLQKIRETRRMAKGGHTKSGGDSNGIRGIMTVRTVDESLHGGAMPEMKKLRRKFTIKLKGADKSVHEDTEDCSVVSNFSGSTASLSTMTMGDIVLGFSHVDIREYELVPGVNPSVLSGPPIELGWAHTQVSTFHIDEWENTRDGRRRLQSQMKIPPDVRRGLLLHHGNSQKLIRDATRNAANGRKQRMQTVDKLNSMGGDFDEKVDNIKRAFKLPFKHK